MQRPTNAPRKYQAGIRSELTAMFNCSTIEESRRKRDTIIADYQDVIESAMSVMMLPKYLRQYFRTSNHIGRINKELKRRSNVIGVFPNEASILRLMGSILMEVNDAAQARRALVQPENIQRADVNRSEEQAYHSSEGAAATTVCIMI